MHIEFMIPSKKPQSRIFLSWSPIVAKVRLIDGMITDAPLRTKLTNSGTVGQMVFSHKLSGPYSPELDVELLQDGSPAEFWLAGQFPNASTEYGDAEITVFDQVTGDDLSRLSCMVRIRKSTENLTVKERDRFISAMADLNDNGLGGFRDFREMHVSASSPEAHGDSAFLPWHRAYLLDLERELQKIDDTVALPYWRFDQAAPKLFSRSFIGMPNSNGIVQFVAGHPLTSWTTNSQVGILRRMSFPASQAPTGLRSQSETILLGGVPPNGEYDDYLTMEGNPHGAAHTRFGGFVSSIPTAARDPLFFLLHCNVDRLWAIWQFLNKTMAPTANGAFKDGGRIGHRRGDTMWPWNGITTAPRPGTAPGGPLSRAPDTDVPSDMPTVDEMIDFQGAGGSSPQNFAYDSVPFEDASVLTG